MSEEEVETDVHDFLRKIHLDKYAGMLCRNGYDEMVYLLDQTKSEGWLSKSDFEELGVRKMGEIAKIIVKLEEEAGILGISVPKAAFFMGDSIENGTTKKIKEYLTKLGLGGHFKNIAEEGYFALELLFAQMLTRCVFKKGSFD